MLLLYLLLSVTSPILAVLDPSSLSSSVSLFSPHPPVYSPVSSSSFTGFASPPSSRPAPPGFPSMPPPRMPVPFSSASGQSGRVFVPGLGSAFSDLVRASGLVQGGGVPSVSLKVSDVTRAPVVEGGSGSVGVESSVHGQGVSFV